MACQKSKEFGSTQEHSQEAAFSQDEVKLDDMLFSDSESASECLDFDLSIPSSKKQVFRKAQSNDNNMLLSSLGQTSGKNRIQYLSAPGCLQETWGKSLKTIHSSAQ